MTKFLIVVPHGPKKESCERAVRSLLATGSHFLTNADWGCPDGEHKAWITVEMDSKEEAIMILPPAFRKDAKIIRLQNFSMENIDEAFGMHDS